MRNVGARLTVLAGVAMALNLLFHGQGKRMKALDEMYSHVPYGTDSVRPHYRDYLN